MLGLYTQAMTQFKVNNMIIMYHITTLTSITFGFQLTLTLYYDNQNNTIYPRLLIRIFRSEMIKKVRCS